MLSASPEGLPTLAYVDIYEGLDAAMTEKLEVPSRTISPQAKWMAVDSDTVAIAKLVRKDIQDRIVAWDELSSSQNISQALALTISDPLMKHGEMPAIWSQVSSLQVLAVPAHLWDVAVRSDRIRMLREITVEGNAKIVVPRERVFDSLERLCLDGKSDLRFDADSFPRLWSLGLGAGKRVDWKQISRLRWLRSVSWSVRQNEDFALIPDCVETLSIGGGNISSLAGIQRLQNLTELSIQGETKLMSIAEITKLGNLHELSLVDCPNVQDPETVLKLPSLRKLFVLPAGKNWHAIASEANSRIGDLTIF